MVQLIITPILTSIAMDEQQLTTVLKGVLGNVFKGVFSSNEIETLSIDSPAAYIFNTKPNDHPGEH